MPASKKDLRKLQQKQNVANGVGDEKGRIASNNKASFFWKMKRAFKIHLIGLIGEFMLLYHRCDN